uniref:Uncharacterized protein n=1 Tax=Anguilla anguilla TaxID=7936 RepID=A0A0E9TA95_ANGAN
MPIMGRKEMHGVNTTEEKHAGRRRALDVHRPNDANLRDNVRRPMTVPCGTGQRDVQTTPKIAPCCVYCI